MMERDVPTSATEPTRTTTRFSLILTSALAGAPFTLMALVHLLSLRGMMFIGHWPRVSLDDPKYIVEGDFLYTALSWAIYVPLLSLIASLALTPILLFWGRKRFAFPLRCAWTLLYAVGWAWLYWDPLQRMDWWID